MQAKTCRVFYEKFVNAIFEFSAGVISNNCLIGTMNTADRSPKINCVPPAKAFCSIRPLTEASNWIINISNTK